MKTILLSVLTMFAGLTVSAQDSVAVRSSQDAPRTPAILSSVPFEGINCCIKIVPSTTRNIDHMPMFNPLSSHHRIVDLRALPAPSDTLFNRLRMLEEEKKNRSPLR